MQIQIKSAYETHTHTDTYSTCNSASSLLPAQCVHITIFVYFCFFVVFRCCCSLPSPVRSMKIGELNSLDLLCMCLCCSREGKIKTTQTSSRMLHLEHVQYMRNGDGKIHFSKMDKTNLIPLRVFLFLFFYYFALVAWHQPLSVAFSL